MPQCATWALGERRAGVACWTARGTPIRICGHGLLCCARVWMDDWSELEHSDQDEAGFGSLVMNETEVSCRAEAGRIWLSFDPLPARPCEIPVWCANYFDTGPVKAANAGPDTGYLVLEWPAGFQLASLPIPPESLEQDTQRALIVTSAATKVPPGAGNNIQYRYFAPQHGVAEDLATGSAMRVLAHYWQQRDLGTALTAYQCSQAGGLLFSRIETGKVWIGGWTSPMAMEADTIE